MAIGSGHRLRGRAAGGDPRARGGDGPAQDGRALAARGARRARGQRGLGDRGGGQLPVRGATRTGPGHHVPGGPPDRWRRIAARHDPTGGRRHRGAGAPGRHAARVRGAGCGHLPGVVRQAASASSPRTTDPAPGAAPARPRHRAAPARRAARRPPGGPASRGRRRHGASAGSTAGSSKPARATVARRRTVGLSSSAPSTAAARPGRRWRPSAATAASRQRVSAWWRAVWASAATAARWRRSPRNQAAPTTTSGSGSARASVRAAGSAERGPCAARPRARRRRRAGARRVVAGRARARRRATSRRPRRCKAPNAATWTAGSGSSRPAAGRTASSPRWPAAATRRRRSRAPWSRSCIRGRIVAHRLRVCPTLTRAPTGAGTAPPPSRRIPSGAATRGARSARAPRAAALARGVAGVHRPGAPRRRPGRRLRGRPRSASTTTSSRRDRPRPSPSTSRCPPQYRPPAHRQDPPDRRLRHPAERAQLPPLPLLRLQQRDLSRASQLFEGAPTEGQFLNQGYLQMAQAQNFATASALTRLGYHVSSTQRRRAGLRHPGQVAGGGDPPRGPGDHRRSTRSPPRRSAR